MPRPVARVETPPKKRSYEPYVSNFDQVLKDMRDEHKRIWKEGGHSVSNLAPMIASTSNRNIKSRYLQSRNNSTVNLSQ